MKKAFIQNLFLKRIARKHYIIVGTSILGITVIHFVLQLSFIQTENLQVIETSVKNIKPVEQTADNKDEEFDAKEYKTKKINNITALKTVKPVVRRQPETAPPPRISPRKKVNRESRAARLRHAEKILTGV